MSSVHLCKRTLSHDDYSFNLLNWELVGWWLLSVVEPLWICMQLFMNMHDVLHCVQIHWRMCIMTWSCRTGAVSCVKQRKTAEQDLRFHLLIATVYSRRLFCVAFVVNFSLMWLNHVTWPCFVWWLNETCWWVCQGVPGDGRGRVSGRGVCLWDVLVCWSGLAGWRSVPSTWRHWCRLYKPHLHV